MQQRNKTLNPLCFKKCTFSLSALWLEQSILKTLFQGQCRALKTMSDWIWFFKKWMQIIDIYNHILFLGCCFFYLCFVLPNKVLQVFSNTPPTPAPYFFFVVAPLTIQFILTNHPILPSGKTSIHHVHPHWFSSNRTYLLSAACRLQQDKLGEGHNPAWYIETGEP